MYESNRPLIKTVTVFEMKGCTAVWNTSSVCCYGRSCSDRVKGRGGTGAGAEGSGSSAHETRRQVFSAV